MKEPQIVRRYEWVLIFCSTIAYVVVSMMNNANKYDNYVGTAQLAGVRLSVIFNDLYGYNNIIDYNIPIIISAALTFLGWAAFHYMAYPKIKLEGWNRQGIIDLTSVVLLISISVFIFIEFTSKTFDFKHDDQGNLIGFVVYSTSGSSFFLTTILSTFTLFCIYELISQLYYNFYIRLKPGSHLEILNYFILFSILSVDILIVFNSLLSNMLSSPGIHQFLSLVLGGIMIYELRNYFSNKVIPQLHSTSESYLKNLIIYLVLCLICSILAWGLFSNFGQSVKPGVAYALTFISLVLIPILLSYVNQKERKKFETTISNKSAELTNLRSQINPHFLFNALNSLYATALTENSDKTADGIQKLGDMMRFMLHENNHDCIPLSSEVAYLRNYIDIQRMRLDETQNIEIRVNIQEPDKEIYIAPMLLNPFIENAFKHGISLQNPSWIYITLTLDSGNVYFKVHNSIHKQTGSDPEKDNAGIGLENVEKRLKLIYPDRYQLHIQKSAQDYFASIILTF